MHLTEDIPLNHGMGRRRILLQASVLATLVMQLSVLAVELPPPAQPVPAKIEIAAGPFDASWDSLKHYRCPDWFRDAKLGIWGILGPQSLPEAGDWYARNMYIEGSQQNVFHIEHYGHPSKFGYKDLVALWKADNFDPERLMARYKNAGAKYFVVLANHHDNFDCWNSNYHAWNAVNVGPRKDIVGLWAQAAKTQGLRFGVSEHLARSYSWFNTNKGSDKKGPLAGVPYDGNDPKFADLYFPPHEDTISSYPKNPPEWWPRQWFWRMRDLIDTYQPDLMYSDGSIPFGEVGRSLFAHFYNATSPGMAASWKPFTTSRTGARRAATAIMSRESASRTSSAAVWMRSSRNRGRPTRASATGSTRPASPTSRRNTSLRCWPTSSVKTEIFCLIFPSGMTARLMPVKKKCSPTWPNGFQSTARRSTERVRGSSLARVRTGKVASISAKAFLRK